ncbi:MAG TPA: crossover junction endodeoxyribonuclease RuvC [bacterium]
MKVLGIDPGLTATGYSVIENNNVIETGTIRPHLKDSNEKIFEICNGIQRAIERNKVSFAVLEKAFYEKNVSSLMRVSELRGALIFMLKSNNIDLYEYTPTQIKLTTTGNGRASKGQVRFFIERIMRRPKTKTSNHAIDAIAIAYTGSKKSSCKPVSL